MFVFSLVAASGLAIVSCSSPAAKSIADDSFEMVALLDKNAIDPDIDADTDGDDDSYLDDNLGALADGGAAAAEDTAAVASRGLTGAGISYLSDDKVLKLAWARAETVNGKAALFGVLRLKKDSYNRAVIHYTTDGTEVNSGSPTFDAKEYGYTNDQKWQKYYFVLPEKQQIASSNTARFNFIVEYKASATVSYLSQKGYTYRVAATNGQSITVVEGKKSVDYTLGQTVLGTRHNVVEFAKITKTVSAAGVATYEFSGNVQVKNEDPNSIVKVVYQLNNLAWSWSDAFGYRYGLTTCQKTANFVDYYPNGYKKRGADSTKPALYGVIDYHFSQILSQAPQYVQFITSDYLPSTGATWWDKNRCRRHWIGSSAAPTVSFPAFYSSYSLK